MATPFTQYIPAPTQLAEQTLISYISGSLYNGGQYTDTNGNQVSGSLVDPTTQWYTGVANNDVEGPAVLVACNGADETVWQSKVWRVNCDISTRMIAYDSQTSTNVTSSAVSLAGNVFSLFGDSTLACNGINVLETGLAAIQVQIKNFQNEIVEDSWISNMNVDLVCTLIRS